MKFFIDTWYLFAMAIVSGALLMWPRLRVGVPAAGVSSAEAVRLINRERGVVIDVREPAEFAAGHIVNAKNIPLSSLDTATNLPKNKAVPVVVACGSGARASRAVLTLQKLGYANARTLTGGMTAWREASLPVEKTA